MHFFSQKCLFKAILHGILLLMGVGALTYINFYGKDENLDDYNTTSSHHDPIIFQNIWCADHWVEAKRALKKFRLSKINNL